MSAPLPNALLTVDTGAILANWRTFARASGPAACGAALKADAYGLGAAATAEVLVAAGCRELFVAHWQEVAALGSLPADVRVAVLHGVDTDDVAFALTTAAVPVLCTPGQVAAWKTTGRTCDVMIDTGMNRLGISPAEAVAGLLDGLAIDALHSHLACAETPGHPQNARQRRDFADLAARIPAGRYALANSGGIGIGPDYCFDLTRPGIGLYGGGAGPEGCPLAAVVALAARILQVRDIAAGDTIGYGATFTAHRPMRLATAAIGYADGYPRSLSNVGGAHIDGVACPLVGRVSMDLTIFDVTDADAREGALIDLDFDLAATAAVSGRSEYELLTGLGARYARTYR